MTIRQKLERQQIVVALREAGATFTQLADLFDVSRQAVFYIYQDATKEERYEIVRRDASRCAVRLEQSKNRATHSV